MKHLSQYFCYDKNSILHFMNVVFLVKMNTEPLKVTRDNSILIRNLLEDDNLRVDHLRLSLAMRKMWVKVIFQASIDSFHSVFESVIEFLWAYSLRTRFYSWNLLSHFVHQEENESMFFKRHSISKNFWKTRPYFGWFTLDSKKGEVCKIDKKITALY